MTLKFNYPDAATSIVITQLAYRTWELNSQLIEATVLYGKLHSILGIPDFYIIITKKDPPKDIAPSQWLAGTVITTQQRYA